MIHEVYDVLYTYIGTISYSLCSNSQITYLNISYNEYIACYDGCLDNSALIPEFYHMDVYSCNALYDMNGLCAVVAATNIESLQTQWTCDSKGHINTNYCMWPGVTCGGTGGSDVVEISLGVPQESGLTGNVWVLLFRLPYIYIQYS